MQTYNEIIKLNQTFAENHFWIETFGNGEVYNIVLHDKQEWFSYPLMWMEDLPLGLNDHELTFNFRVYFIAQVATLKEREGDKMETNENEVKSNMVQCATDLLSFWAQDTTYPELDLVRSGAITTITDKFSDRVTGCYVDLKLKQGFRYNKCAIPMTGVTPPPSELCQPVTFTLNTAAITETASGGVKTIIVQNDAAIPAQVGTVILDDANNLTVSVPEAGATVLNTADVYRSGATSYYNGDDGDIGNGRGADFLTLDINNPFGNTDRFTDKLGTQVYADGIALNWASWDQEAGAVMGIEITPQTNTNLKAHLDAQPFTVDTYSDWYVLNVKQLFSLCNYGLFRDYLNYPPFNLNTGLTVNRVWSSTMENVSNGIFLSNVGISVSNQSATNKAFITRNYTMAELGL